MSLRSISVAVALAGAAVAGYLTWIHYAGIEPVCGLGGDCHKVQTSEWSELGGVPVALLGLLGYATIVAALAVRGLVVALAVAWFGFAFSLYLTYREIFSIEAICPWCVVSAVLMTILAALTTTAYLTQSPR